LPDGVFAHPGDLVLPHRAHRTGHHGEVVRRDCNRPPVDLADARDRAISREITITETLVHVIGEQPVLDPRVGIEQQVESFAHGELAQRALAFDELGATHAERALFALREIADERTPVVTRIRHRYRPFHCGARFSANAATPSAASSVCDVTVSIVCKYESAASASISSTR
jgi:hypothetical protein